MASDREFVQNIVDKIDEKCEVTFKMMFGEYGIYSKGKMVAVISDNRLFVKPTDAGKEYIGDFVEASAYPGAKPSLLIEDKLGEPEWLTGLIVITEKALSKPKKKKRKKQ